jgi:uncharacterized membrane protein YcaP (DUF421 family)
MDLVLRTVVIFFFMLVISRAIGRRELANLEPFDLILLVVMGDLIQQGVTQSDNSVTGTMIVLSTLALLIVALSYLNFRAPRLRPILDGEPLVLVEHGKPIPANLARERITEQDLTQQARLQQIASIADVEWAVLETSGNISFIPMSQPGPNA